MMNYFGKRFEGIEKKLQQPSNEKAKSLANILFGFPVREPQVNITASPPPPPPPEINENSTSDFLQITSPRMAYFDACNGPVVAISDQGEGA